jgi:hypothetical protein
MVLGTADLALHWARAPPLHREGIGAVPPRELDFQCTVWCLNTESKSTITKIEITSHLHTVASLNACVAEQFDQSPKLNPLSMIVKTTFRPTVSPLIFTVLCLVVAFPCTLRLVLHCAEWKVHVRPIVELLGEAQNEIRRLNGVYAPVEHAVDFSAFWSVPFHVLASAKACTWSVPTSWIHGICI